MQCRKKNRKELEKKRQGFLELRETYGVDSGVSWANRNENISSYCVNCKL